MTAAWRALIGLVAVAMLAAGAAFALAPTRIAADFAVAATGLAGLGTLRANLGAGFIVMGAFALAALRPGQARWLVVPMVFLASLLALRLLHLGVDGASAAGLRSTAVELVLLALVCGAHRRLSAVERV